MQDTNVHNTPEHNTNTQDSRVQNTSAQNTTQAQSSESSVPAPALSFWQRWGGYSGLIPFFGLSLLSITGFEFAHQALISYAALIVSLLGGVIWSFSLQPPAKPQSPIVCGRMHAAGLVLASLCQR